jgi:hypothetical protein
MLITMRTLLHNPRGRSPRKLGADFPEVIIRKTCTFFEKRDKAYPVPEILLLANRAGFLWLSNVFARFARKTGLDEHEHLDPGDPQINPIHSDEVAFRLGILTRINRQAVFKKYGITQRRPFKGDLVSQYRRQIIEARSLWKSVREMDREAITCEAKENRQWQSALDRLRRKQKLDINQSANKKSPQPRKIRRFFRGVAKLKVSAGFRPPPAGRTEFMIYVFARTRREACRLFADGLKSAGYKVGKISKVAAHRSHLPVPMDQFYIRPENVLRAWETGEVWLGWSWI